VRVRAWPHVPAGGAEGGAPGSDDEFDEGARVKFRKACAAAAGVGLSRVRILSVVAIQLTRRLLADGIQVDLEVEVPEQTTLEELSSSMSQDSLNQQLAAQGMPEALGVVAPVLAAGGGCTGRSRRPRPRPRPLSLNGRRRRTVRSWC